MTHRVVKIEESTLFTFTVKKKADKLENVAIIINKCPFCSNSFNFDFVNNKCNNCHKHIPLTKKKQKTHYDSNSMIDEAFNFFPSNGGKVISNRFDISGADETMISHKDKPRKKKNRNVNFKENFTEVVNVESYKIYNTNMANADNIVGRDNCDCKCLIF